ncbi:unnamed protein product [Amoebophrya sp. A25]|nr:unnamed protein product [Amoebophrya sp. A25]|eukprot:GSA25T00013406001.1
MKAPALKSTAPAAAASGTSTTATSSEVESSRVMLKNIPPYATDKRLRERFAEFGSITDVKILTKNGMSRQLAFLGFKTVAEAKKCVAASHRTYFDTHKMQVEIARPVGDTGIARPWSKYSEGSSSFAKSNTTEKSSNLEKVGDAEKKESKAVKKTSESSSAKSEVDEIPADESDETASKTVANDATVTDADYLAQFKTGADDLDSDLEDDPLPTKALEDDTEQRGPPTSGAGATEKAAEQVLKGDSSPKNEDESEPSGKKGATSQSGTTSSSGGELAAAVTGRVFVRNLPYSCTDDEVREFFAQEGEVGGVKICIDEDTKRSRGFGFVTYVFPEHAVRAVSLLDGRCFQGRLISIRDAQIQEDEQMTGKIKSTEHDGAKDGETNAELTKDKNATNKAGDAKSSYKKLKNQERKQQQSERIWNLLYMSANAATDAIAKKLGVEKRDLLDKESSQLAVTVALGETQVLQETKQWLEREGIWVDAFTRQGTNLLSAVKNPMLEGDAESNKKSRSSSAGEDAASSSKVRRAKDVMIVKHLPSESVVEHELRERFARFGDVKRFCLAPAKTVAVVQFASAQHAERAFAKVNFSRYKHVPLFLEWAPEQIFAKDASEAGAHGEATTKDDSTTQEPNEDASASTGSACIFVKNLSFSTGDMRLEQIFRQHAGFRRVTIMKKKGVDGEKKSMGYGFIEYETVNQCEEVVKKRQALALDGHILHLQVSSRQAKGNSSLAGAEIKNAAISRSGAAGADAVSSSSVAAGSKAKQLAHDGKPLSNKLCVRNVAFETTKGELSALFAPYGTVTSLRLPKKADRSGQHRGFAFVDFLTKSEACAAFEALQHTHLYGRKLVLEPAEKEALTVEELQLAQLLTENKTSEKQKRKREAVAEGDENAKSGFASLILDDSAAASVNAKKPAKKKRKVAK